MSFIRNKGIGGNIYRYRVETYYTKDGKPRQRVLEYLGRVVKTKRGEKLIKPRSSIDRPAGGAEVPRGRWGTQTKAGELDSTG